MASSSYLRLRQICLAARDLHKAERLVTQVLGLEPAFRDERVGRYGLVNVVLPLGSSFLEIIAPTEANTAAGRFLDRFNERRGYMAIFDCSDLSALRTRVEQLGIRVLHSRQWPRYENIQLHPRDTGATMLEFHHNVGGDDLNAYYEPAGEDWHRHVRDDRAIALLGAEFTAVDPLALAGRWSKLFDRPLRHLAADQFEIVLDNARLRFLPGAADEQLHAVNVSVRDVAAVLDTAQKLGVAIQDQSVDLCGVWFRLSRA